MRKLFHSLVLAGFLALPLGAAELDQVFEKRAEFWNLSGETLMADYPDSFAWMDNTGTRLRFNAAQTRAKLSLFGSPVQEVIFNFNDGKLADASISVYNRGDAGEWTMKQFDSRLAGVRSKLSELMGSVVPQPQSAALASSRVNSLTWRSGEMDVVLRWSSSRRNQPEYIAIDFHKTGEAPKNLRTAMKTGVGSSELAQNVTVGEDGSRFISIPMVDQGAKGYCVAATVERVLRYYGSDLDQHVIAQIAESDAERGTSINKIINALENSQSKLGIKFRRYYQYNGLEDFNDLRKLIRDYNSVAKSAKKEKIDLDDYIITLGKHRYLDFGSLMKGMDFSVFRDLRKKERAGNRTFVTEVKSSIDEGIPLCWATFIFPGVGDVGNNAEFGMHMRIINGYNPKTDELIYTDSWGAGHEKKVLKMDDAWGLTVSLIALTPRARKTRSADAP